MPRSRVTSSGLSKSSWPACGAALWALIFTVLHLVWAGGWYVGLDAERAQKAFARTGFVVYDLVTAGLCALAIPIALAPVQPWGRRVPRWLLGSLASAGTSLLLLRSAGSIIQMMYALVTGRFLAEPMQLWELWFYLGAFLFCLSTWRFLSSGRKHAA